MAFFSYTLTINEKKIANFGEVTITEAVDGMGTSGVCISQLKFTVKASDLIEVPPPNAEVTFDCNEHTLTLPKFYISSRTKVNNIYTFVCLDRGSKLSQKIAMSDTDYINDEISTWNVLFKIVGQCGYDGVPSIPAENISMLPKAQVEGKSCRDILDTLSKALCGFWCTKKGEKNAEHLVLNLFGDSMAWNIAQNYTTVVENISKGPIECVEMSGNNDFFTSGNPYTDIFRKLKISSPIASNDLCGDVFSRVENYVYEAWSCEKIRLSMGVWGMHVGCDIGFADKTRRCNNITITPSATAIFVKASNNVFTENEYDYEGSLTRQLNRCVKDDEIYNNQLLTRYQGLIFTSKSTLNTRADTGTETTINKNYGYKVHDNGVVEFDGAMINKIVPSAVTVNYDATVCTYTLGGRTYQLNITWNGDNISSLEQEVLV